MARSPTSTTLRELLTEVRGGFSLYNPILVSVEGNTESGRSAEWTADQTITLDSSPTWAEETAREYADERYLMLGENTPRSMSALPITIGRSRQCDVRVGNESVSKVHASLVYDRNDGAYYVVDENSRNGTYLNGEQLEAGTRSAVIPGAYVAFGSALFVFIDPETVRTLARIAL